MGFSLPKAFRSRFLRDGQKGPQPSAARDFPLRCSRLDAEGEEITHRSASLADRSWPWRAVVLSALRSAMP